MAFLFPFLLFFLFCLLLFVAVLHISFWWPGRPVSIDQLHHSIRLYDTSKLSLSLSVVRSVFSHSISLRIIVLFTLHIMFLSPFRLGL